MNISSVSCEFWRWNHQQNNYFNEGSALILDPLNKFFLFAVHMQRYRDNLWLIKIAAKRRKKTQPSDFQIGTYNVEPSDPVAGVENKPAPNARVSLSGIYPQIDL